MRIVHVIGGGERGGSRAHLLTLCRGLRERNPGIEVQIVCLMDDVVAAEARQHRIPLALFPMKNPADLRAILPLRRHLRSLSPAIVHTHGVRANFVGRLAARGLGAAVITTVHSSVYSDYAALPKRSLYPPIERMTRRHTDRFIVVASSLQRELERDGVPSERITLIYNSLPEPPPARRDPGISLRDELGIGPERPIVMSVGRLEAVKDPETLLDVFSALRRRVAFHGVIVGDGSLRRSLERRAEAQDLGGVVSFLGFRSDVPSLLAGADVYLSTSRMEGLSVALLEAMRARTPVVVSRVGGMPEVVRLAGNGFTVSLGDVGEYGARVEQLLRDPPLRETLSRRGARALDRHFSVESFVTNTWRTYREEAQRIGNARNPYQGRGRARPSDDRGLLRRAKHR